MYQFWIGSQLGHHRRRAINDFSEAGYEFNVNFGPVIAKEGWQRDYGPRPARIVASRGLAP
jgi:hypothetical protein